MENIVINLIEPCEYDLQINLVEDKSNCLFELINGCYQTFSFYTSGMFNNVINIINICETEFTFVNIGDDFDTDVNLICFTIDNEIYFITKDLEHFKTSLDQYISVLKNNN